MAGRKNKPVSAHLRHSRAHAPVCGTSPELLGISFDDDEATITFRDWSADNLRQVVRLHIFQQTPALVIPCAAFLLGRGASARPATREGFVKKLRYLQKFISAYGVSYGIRVTEYAEFSSRFMEEYLKWLRGEGDVRPKVNNKGHVSKLTAANVYKLTRDLILWISDHEEYSQLAPKEISFDLKPSDKGYRDVKPRAALPESDLKLIRQACFDELESTIAKLKRGRSIIEDSSIAVPNMQSSAKNFKDLEVCVKAYHSVQHRELQKKMKVAYPSLKRALRPPYHTLGEVLEHLHFTSRSIVPVMVLLEMHFGFEPDTFVLLDWSNEKDSQLYGATRGVVTGVKFRGGQRRKSKSYARKDSAKFSPAALFRILKETSTETAKLVGSDCEKIFCFARHTGTFGFFRNSAEFSKPLRRFIEEHHLPDFTLSSLRKTGGMLIGKLTGGDVAAQKEHQQHETVNTTLRSYQDESNAARRADGLAETLNIRARRIKSGGKIDTRGAGLPTWKKLAATFGYYCLDPYDSPQAGQIRGQLCQAYGRCPTCPLAAIDHLSPHDCCRLLQLRARLMEARTMVDPSRWQRHWLPQLLALDNDWLPAFTSHTRKKASSMVLPPIPEVD